MSLLFVTWDGPGTRYLESLFFPILAQLREVVRSSHVLQFTYADSAETERSRAAAAEYGLGYRAIPVPAPQRVGHLTALTIAAGAAIVASEARRTNARIIMPRSTIPAMMALLAPNATKDRTTVFDADGLMQDERVDFGNWSASGLQYRVFRDVESMLVRRADAVITRTLAAKRILVARAGAGVDETKIHVIPNGKDAKIFRPIRGTTRAAVRAELGVAADSLLLVYCGSLGPQYYPEAMLSLFAFCQAWRSDVRMLWLTNHLHEAKRFAASVNEHEERLIIRSVEPNDVPRYLGASDIGLALRAPTFSQRAVCPIKVGEYLLCGLPVIAVRGVGDLDEQLTNFPGAHLMDHVDADTIATAAAWAIDRATSDDDSITALCRTRGERHFTLDHTSHRYIEVLNYAQRRTSFV